MAGGIDLVSSLLRSTARSAASSLKNTPLAGALRRMLAQVSVGRVIVSDRQLTRAVAHVPGVAAATVSCTQGRLRIDVSFEQGAPLQMALVPAGVAFAPGGAKELSFRAEPPESAHDLRSRDVLAALAGEIARGLWRPVLGRAERSDQGAYVTADGAQLSVDLRSVPEVRWAMSQRVPAAIIEALKPRALAVHAGRLLLSLSLERL